MGRTWRCGAEVERRIGAMIEEPFPLGGAVPLPRKMLILALNMVSFGCITVRLPAVIHVKQYNSVPSHNCLLFIRFKKYLVQTKEVEQTQQNSSCNASAALCYKKHGNVTTVRLSLCSYQL